MPLDPPATWGQKVAQAIKAVGVDNSAPITDTQLAQIWEQVKTEDTAQLAQAAVAPGSFANGGGPVAGVGGPIN